MKAILSLIISGALVVSGYAQTRNVLVGTNNTVVQPTNFWSADASNARTGLGLGTAATNPASAFQPSSATLSNLASSNAVNLTNLRATNLIGLIPTSNIPSTTLTNISGTLAITQGGTGATNIGNARTNLGATSIGDAVFTATNAAAARTAIGALATNGDATNLTNFPANLLRTNGNGSGLANLTAANITGTVGLASNVTGTVAISNGGTGATNAGGARTNLGLGITNNVEFEIVSANGNIDTPQIFIQQTTNGIIVFEDATNAVRLRSDVGLGKTNLVEFGTIQFGDQQYQDYKLMLDGAGLYTVLGAGLGGGTNFIFDIFGSANFLLHRPISFNNTNNATISRTNLGLGLPALTNTNNANFLAAFFGANTNPVLVNTNGEVVSPTNFWQVSPANTRVQLVQPVVNATNTATNARNLFLYSLAISTTGVTNTIQLPTNGGTLLGDVATVIHEGPTSSITAVRQIGSGTNIITLNQFQEAVKFIYEAGGWRLADNLTFVEPIYFSGTNASANAAASRTNLGLGNISMVSNSIVVTTNFTATNGEAVFTNLRSDYLEFKTLFISDSTNTNVIVWEIPTQRTNFLHGLGLGPTNSVTFSEVTTGNVSGSTEESSIQFDQDILRLSADNIINLESPTEAVSTLTAKTNLVVEGFVDYTAARTNNTPTNTPNFAAHAAWIEVKIGTNSFFLPAYQ